jgi:hypothetical protein
LVFETLLNKEDPKLYQFRRSVCEENGGSEIFLTKDFTRSQVGTILKDEKVESAEEVYKFGKKKWSQSKLASIEAVSVDGQIVSISACEYFNSNALRVGMFLYTLKSHRVFVRGHMFSEDGFFSRHIRHARQTGRGAVFLSVYPHSKKLQAHAMNLFKHKRAITSVKQPYLKDLELLGTRPLNGVEQIIIGYKLDHGKSWNQFLPEFFPSAPGTVEVQC